MEQVFIVPVIIVGSIVWLSVGYFAGRRDRKYFAQNYPGLRKTNDDWGKTDEVAGILLMLAGPLGFIAVYLKLKDIPVLPDPHPDLHFRPMKPRYPSIFGTGD